MVGSVRWGYFRIITGTILGGILGFYVMHRTELHYKEIWNERLKKYEEELNRKKEKRNQLDQEFCLSPDQMAECLHNFLSGLAVMIPRLEMCSDARCQ
ncbi:uncharacterized protein LOC127789966 isoform X2 [Diospyros lotus]|uniref:uncharacterized protein LOC127789966 isoform X2 n=1 Tax=Diospyros lotus TaxID=55363 RepID=UPI00225A25D9|nr:uncharacterized protein LOC127789966 isoform X2 [Diospyros lotus]